MLVVDELPLTMLEQPKRDEVSLPVLSILHPLSNTELSTEEEITEQLSPIET